MTDDLVRILDGNTFVVSDSRGDIEASATEPTGLFSYDTRFLSRWVLTVDGGRLTSLSTDDLKYYESKFFLVPGTGSVYVNATMSVIRLRDVGAGFKERLTVLNHDSKAVDISVRLDAGSDFADLFEVKDALTKQGTYDTRTDGGRLVLGYQRGEVPPGDRDLQQRAGGDLRGRADLRGAHRAARRVEHRPAGRGIHGAPGRAAGTVEQWRRA